MIILSSSLYHTSSWNLIYFNFSLLRCVCVCAFNTQTNLSQNCWNKLFILCAHLAVLYSRRIFEVHKTKYIVRMASKIKKEEPGEQLLRMRRCTIDGEKVQANSQWVHWLFAVGSLNCAKYMHLAQYSTACIEWLNIGHQVLMQKYVENSTWFRRMVSSVYCLIQQHCRLYIENNKTAAATTAG